VERVAKVGRLLEIATSEVSNHVPRRDEQESQAAPQEDGQSRREGQNHPVAWLNPSQSTPCREKHGHPHERLGVGPTVQKTETPSEVDDEQDEGDANQFPPQRLGSGQVPQHKVQRFHLTVALRTPDKTRQSHSVHHHSGKIDL
jgi:hypothetical protein